MKKKTTECRLASAIMEYWTSCICKDVRADKDINDLLENFVEDCSVHTIVMISTEQF